MILIIIIYVFTHLQAEETFYKKQKSKFTSQAHQKATPKLEYRVCYALNRHSMPQYDYISRADKCTMIRTLKVDTDTQLKVGADISDEVNQLSNSEDE